MSTWTDKNILFLSLPVDQLLAITAYGEAASEGGEGMMAVLNVIRNRAANVEVFGDREILNLTGSPYHAVILKEKQFSMYNLGTISRQIAEDLARNFDSKILSNSILQTAYNLAQMLLSGQLADNTGGADYYHATYVSPSWAPKMYKTVQIGRHIFYASSATEIVQPTTAALATFVPEEPFPEEGATLVDYLKYLLPFLMLGGLVSGFIYKLTEKRRKG